MATYLAPQGGAMTNLTFSPPTGSLPSSLTYDSSSVALCYRQGTLISCSASIGSARVWNKVLNQVKLERF